MPPRPPWSCGRGGRSRRRRSQKLSASAANCFDNAASFFSSPAWKRTFSSSSTPPSGRAFALASASGPTLVSENSTGTPSSALKRVGDGTQTLFRIDLPLRTAEVAAQNDLRALSDQLLQRRQGLLDAGGIGDDHGPVLLLQRHIEVHAHEAAFAGRSISRMLFLAISLGVGFEGGEGENRKTEAAP